ncbi:MAG: RNA 2',3'-cyclic phosphodiesterase [Dehalococcoidia bacterium]|nr:RNA 2',3'-cyclic phosphodiesterase [Dehalococcoidia bacterium]
MVTPETARLFIVAELPTAAMEELAKLQAQLKKASANRAARWVSPDNIHLTISFLDEVVLSRIDSVKNAIRLTAGEFSFIDLTLKGIGAFPNFLQPRVLWAGLGGDITKLAALQKHLEARLSQAGFISEKRAFRPHLTLARLHNESIPNDKRRLEASAGKATFTAQTFSVTSISLMQSRLTPSVPIYTRLFSTSLRA